MITTYRLLGGDVRAMLATVADGSAQTVVTSPPYWGLRDYGLEASVWGGDAAHEHEWGDGLRRTGGARCQGSSSIRLGRRANVRAQEFVRDAGNACACGAWRGCLGLEPTPELYVAHIVEVFREVRRVLRDDGTLWLNLGDSYSDSGRGADVRSTLQGTRQNQAESRKVRVRETATTGLRPKNLIGIPWRVAFALQADGWYLRSDIIWSKPNPMPESVTDRPTKAHEYLFLLSKRERYFYDADAIKEPAVASGRPHGPNSLAEVDHALRPRNGYKMPDGWNTGPGAHGSFHPQGREKGRPAPKGNAKTFRGGGAYTGGQSFDNSADTPRESHGNVPNETGLRNKRSVWTIATQPFPEAHFATFPEALVEPCILAGSRPGDLVLDPFSGSGTSGVVALQLGRHYLGVELNPEYLAMSRRRLAAVAPLLAKEAIG